VFEPQVLHTQRTDFANPHSCVTCETEKCFVETRHDAVNFVGSEPPLFVVRQVRQFGIPADFLLVLLFLVPVTDGTKELPQVVRGLRFQRPLQRRDPVVNVASSDVFEPHLPELRSDVLLDSQFRDHLR
jgi:hypothetical protein